MTLSTEEKRKLLREGYKIPTKFPLSEYDIEGLKIVRRKIENKVGYSVNLRATWQLLYDILF